MALTPERLQYLADLANEEWVDRLPDDVLDDDERLDAMAEEIARERERFVRGATDPEELHAFAERWNWDYGYEAMRAVTENPACEAGTALMIYWRNRPEYYAVRAWVPDHAAEGYALHAAVEARLLAGAFPARRIYYDPRADGMTMSPGVPRALHEPVGEPPGGGGARAARAPAGPSPES